MLSKDKKYTAQMVLSEDNINKLMKEKNLTREQAIEELFKGNKNAQIKKPETSVDRLTKKDKTAEKGPNGKTYEENDIKFLTNRGLTREQAIEILKKDKKYTEKITKVEKPETSVDRLSKKKKKLADMSDDPNANENLAEDKQLKGPNGLPYTQNDIDYLMNKGYTKEQAIEELKKDKKYTTKLAPNGNPYEEKDIEKLTENGLTREQAIEKLSKEDKYTKVIDESKETEKTKDKKSQNSSIEQLVEKYTNLLSNKKKDKKEDEESKLETSKDILKKIYNLLATVFGMKKSKDDKKKETEDKQEELAPNGKAYDEKDIEKLTKNGLTREQAIEVLKKDKKYTKKITQLEKSETSVDRLIKNKKYAKDPNANENLAEDKQLKGPNGKAYEQNDIDYLVNKGYTKEQAIEELKKDKKYTTKLAPNGKAYEQNDIDYLIDKGYNETEAIKELELSEKYNKKEDKNIVSGTSTEIKDNKLTKQVVSNKKVTKTSIDRLLNTEKLTNARKNYILDNIQFGDIDNMTRDQVIKLYKLFNEENIPEFNRFDLEKDDDGVLKDKLKSIVKNRQGRFDIEKEEKTENKGDQLNKSLNDLLEKYKSLGAIEEEETTEIDDETKEQILAKKEKLEKLREVKEGIGGLGAALSPKRNKEYRNIVAEMGTTENEIKDLIKNYQNKDEEEEIDDDKELAAKKKKEETQLLAKDTLGFMSTKKYNDKEVEDKVLSTIFDQIDKVLPGSKKILTPAKPLILGEEPKTNKNVIDDEHLIMHTVSNDKPVLGETKILSTQKDTDKSKYNIENIMESIIPGSGSLIKTGKELVTDIGNFFGDLFGKKKKSTKDEQVTSSAIEIIQPEKPETSIDRLTTNKKKLADMSDDPNANENLAEDKQLKGPNGLPYTQNDIDYLLNEGYTIEQAIEMLSKDKKYTTKLAPNGNPYEEKDIEELTKNGLTREQAIEELSKEDKYTEEIEEVPEEQETYISDKDKLNLAKLVRNNYKLEKLKEVKEGIGGLGAALSPTRNKEYRNIVAEMGRLQSENKELEKTLYEEEESESNDILNNESNISKTTKDIIDDQSQDIFNTKIKTPQLKTKQKELLTNDINIPSLNIYTNEAIINTVSKKEDNINQQNIEEPESVVDEKAAVTNDILNIDRQEPTDLIPTENNPAIEIARDKYIKQLEEKKEEPIVAGTIPEVISSTAQKTNEIFNIDRQEPTDLIPTENNPAIEIARDEYAKQLEKDENEINKIEEKNNKIINLDQAEIPYMDRDQLLETYKLLNEENIPEFNRFNNEDIDSENTAVLRDKLNTIIENKQGLYNEPNDITSTLINDKLNIIAKNNKELYREPFSTVTELNDKLNIIAKNNKELYREPFSTVTELNDKLNTIDKNKPIDTIVSGAIPEVISSTAQKTNDIFNIERQEPTDLIPTENNPAIEIARDENTLPTILSDGIQQYANYTRNKKLSNLETADLNKINKNAQILEENGVDILERLVEKEQIIDDKLNEMKTAIEGKNQSTDIPKPGVSEQLVKFGNQITNSQQSNQTSVNNDNTVNTTANNDNTSNNINNNTINGIAGKELLSKVTVLIEEQLKTNKLLSSILEAVLGIKIPGADTTEQQQTKNNAEIINPNTGNVITSSKQAIDMMTAQSYKGTNRGLGVEYLNLNNNKGNNNIDTGNIPAILNYIAQGNWA